jgi:hypothetical protein
LLLRGCGEARGREAAEKIRTEINAMRFIWQDSAFPVSVSIGLTEINQFNRTINEVLMQADTACYSAKDAGRNCIRVYSAGNEELAQRRGDLRHHLRHGNIEIRNGARWDGPAARLYPPRPVQQRHFAARARQILCGNGPRRPATHNENIILHGLFPRNHQRLWAR